MNSRGFFGIGILNPKTKENVGTLWRSAQAFGASFMFTIGRRYSTQCTDTTKAHRSTPLYNYNTFNDFYDHIPMECRLVGVELAESAEPITEFKHPQQAAYLLGAEDNGLSKEAIAKCKSIIVLPGIYCLNVSVAGSIVMFDRVQKFPRTQVEGKP